MDTFRHTLLLRLSLLLLVAILPVDPVAERCSEPLPAAEDILPGGRGVTYTATLESGSGFESETVAEAACTDPDSRSQLLEIQDFLDAARAAAGLHRVPRLSRPQPDGGCGAASDELRRTNSLPALRLIGRTLRAHHSLYCVYRI